MSVCRCFVVDIAEYRDRPCVCVCLVQASFVMRHQNAVVYVALFLGVLMLTSSLGLIFTQHINIIHVSMRTYFLAVIRCLSSISHCCCNDIPLLLVDIVLS